ncbi:glucokinase [Candidatus Epulonipiscioides gigas]|nr:glucokinase [Epulopiscium sp. SCG-C07WGA-EpuloA2]
MYYIGLDIGGMSLKAGLVDENYNVIDTLSCSTKKEQHLIIEDIATLCKDIITKHNLTQSDINSIGIGFPGLTNPVEGIIQAASNVNLVNVNIKTELSKFLTIPIFIENDANVAALGEVLCGAAKGARSAVVLTIGTGVGGGIILDGKIYGGAFFGAGEIGHQVIHFESDLICGCGRTGCYEQFASATALARMAKEAVYSNPNTKILDFAKDIDNISAKNVFDAKDIGDELAKNILNKYFYFVSLGLTNLINILQPEYIIIGGAMSVQKENLINPIIENVKKQMYKGTELYTQIKAATLGNTAGIIGAAMLGKK